MLARSPGRGRPPRSWARAARGLAMGVPLSSTSRTGRRRITTGALIGAAAGV